MGLAVGGLQSGALASGSGSTVTLAAVGSTPNANGASLAVQVLNLQPADATHPGALTAIAQSIGGAKTFGAAAVFSSTVALNGVVTATQSINEVNSELLLTNSSLQMTVAGTPIYNSGGVMVITGQPADGATAVAVQLGATLQLFNAAAKLLSVTNNSVEKASILIDGSFTSGNALTGQSVGITTKGNSRASPGDATLNTGSGISAIASGAGSCTISNSRCLLTSQVIICPLNGDTTCASIYVSTIGAGGFTVSAFPAAPTGNFGFGWLLLV